MRMAYGIAAWVCVALVSARCEWQSPVRPAATAPPDPSAEQARYLSQMAVRDETARPAASGVDVALEWSNKYAQASEKVVELTAKSQELTNDNRQLGAQIARLEIDLENTRQQLNDANTMLIEVRGELEKWKANVLGFRNEMRTAQQVQLEALAKVLKLLDGEMPASLEAATTETTANAAQPAQP